MSNWPNIVTIGDFLSDKDETGDYRLTTGIEGWGSPPIRIDIAPHTGRHGGWGPRPLFAAKTITHAGLIEQATAAQAQAIADELAALQSGSLLPYVVDNEAIGARSVMVHVAVGAEPEWIDDRSFTYSVTLTAPDPFKRTPTPVTVAVAAGATGSFTGAGAYVAEIEVTTTSAGTVDLASSGLALLADSVPSGTVFTSGRGFTNSPRTVVGPTGENLYGLTLPGMQWPAVVPGANSFVNAGSAAVEITYYPTYA